eukprot:m51a1_g1980 hypothetical protein (441) ;mRNA; f:1121689-1123361
MSYTSFGASSPDSLEKGAGSGPDGSLPATSPSPQRQQQQQQRDEELAEQKSSRSEDPVRALVAKAAWFVSAAINHRPLRIAVCTVGGMMLGLLLFIIITSSAAPQDQNYSVDDVCPTNQQLFNLPSSWHDRAKVMLFSSTPQILPKNKTQVTWSLDRKVSSDGVSALPVTLLEGSSIKVDVSLDPGSGDGYWTQFVVVRGAEQYSRLVAGKSYSHVFIKQGMPASVSIEPVDSTDTYYFVVQNRDRQGFTFKYKFDATKTFYDTKDAVQTCRDSQTCRFEIAGARKVLVELPFASTCEPVRVGVDVLRSSTYWNVFGSMIAIWIILVVVSCAAIWWVFVRESSPYRASAVVSPAETRSLLSGAGASSSYGGAESAVPTGTPGPVSTPPASPAPAEAQADRELPVVQSNKSPSRSPAPQQQRKYVSPYDTTDQFFGEGGEN